MADFLDTFKRRESSEGSNIDDEEDEPHQFAREEINHQSDEEDNRPNERRNQNNDRSRPYQGEENKDTRDQGQNRNAYPAGQAQNKKKDYYLYQGEEKPYESEEEEGQGQGKGAKPKRENLKNKKKDPTYVPKGTFYQHDTRGDETEYVPKKSGGNQGKLKWRHDKFEKGGNKDNGFDKKEGGEHPTFVNKQKEVVYYVVKGANEQKPAEEPQQQQQQRPQQQRQQQPREDRPQQQSRGKGYDYDKGGYGNDKDRGYGNDRDRGYNQNTGKYREYPKKDNYKKSGGGNTGGKQDVYYEYVPKKQV